MRRPQPALAGAFVVVGPCAMSSSAAAAEGGPTIGPREVTGRITCDTSDDIEGSVDRIDLEDGTVLSRKRGWTWHQVATMNDPRLEGTHYISYDWDEQGPSNVRVGAQTWRIENGDGAWQGSFIDLSLAADEWTLPLAVLDGEGGYEGLTALLRGNPMDGSCGLEVSGVIIEGAVPAPPRLTPE